MSNADAFTATTHIVVVLMLLMGMWRIMHRPRADEYWDHGARTMLSPCVAICFLTFAIERGYYFCARILAHTGFDLWSLHPAPALLSGMLWVGVLTAQWPTIVSTHGREAAPGRFAFELSLWAGVGWLIYLVLK